METLHCPVCGEITPHKRAFGIGTLIAFLCTFGLWVLIMPFYPIRCTGCGRDYYKEKYK